MSDKFLDITLTAKKLGVSVKTLRRWEARGILSPVRTGGNHRRYNPLDVERFYEKLQKSRAKKSGEIAVGENEAELLDIRGAARKLGVSSKTLRRWEEKGVLKPIRTEGNHRRYSIEYLKNFKANPAQRFGAHQDQIQEGQSLQVSEAVSTASYLLPQSSPLGRGSMEERREFVSREEYVAPLTLNSIMTADEKLREEIRAESQKSTPRRTLLISFATLGSTIGVIFLIIFLTQFYLSPAENSAVKATKISDAQKVISQASNLGRSVLAASASNIFKLHINIPSEFSQNTNFLGNVSIKGLTTASGGIDTQNSNINAGAGTLTASNVIYSITAGQGIGVTSGQNPTISNSGVLSLQGSSGAVTLTAGSGISISGTTITNTSQASTPTINTFANVISGSTTITASGNNDSLTFTAGSGVTITPNSGSKTLTFASSGAGGDVNGPGASADNAIARFDGTTGKLIQNSGVIIDDSNNITGIANLTLSNTLNAQTGINTGATAGTQRIDSSGNLVNIGTINAAGAVTFSNYNANNNVLFATVTTGLVAGASTNSTGLCLTSGASAPSWTNCSAAASNYWQLNSGAISPFSNTLDVLVGATSTTSAKFAVLNVNSGTPVASLSAGTNGGSYLTADGTLQTTANQSLTLGGSTTGNITISPLNGAGVTTNTGNFNLSSGKVYQINGTSVLSSTTLGSAVVNSSLTQVGALSSGSIASGFGTIATANTITGTTLNGTTGINTGATAGTQRIDSSGNLVNIGTINAAGAVTFSTFSSNGGPLYTNGSGVLAQVVAGTNQQCLLGGTTPTFGSCGTGVTTDPFWSQSSGLLYANNSTVDFSIGGQATTSAKFAVLNVNGTGPATASVSGNLVVMPTNGAGGTLAVGTTSPLSALDVHGGHNNPALNSSIGSIATFTSDTTVQLQFGAVTGGSYAAWIQSKVDGQNTAYPISLQPAGGSVAIGTVTPSVFAGLTIANASSTGSNRAIAFDDGALNGLIGIPGTSNQIVAGSTVDDLAFRNTSAAGNIIFGTNTGVEGLRLSSINEIGMGTQAPIAELHVTRPLSFGVTGKALAIFDQIENQDILTGSSAGTTKFTFTNNGNIQFAGGQSVLTTLASANTTARTITIPLTGSNDTFCLSTAGNCAGTNYWQLNSGAISPFSNTLDVLVGATSTTSAKFAVLNVNSGTPVASLSAGTNGGSYLTADGTLQTTANQSLTLGGSTTGNITISPLNGAGVTTNTGNFNLSSGKVYQINGTSVLSSTTLGSAVVNSSLTQVGALSSGSIASGFGTIATANTITGTTLNGTTGINTGATAGTQRIDSSGNLVNIGTINAAGAVTFSTFSSNGGPLYTNGSGVLAQVVAGTNQQCLLGGTTPTFGSCGTGVTTDPFWSQSSGLLYANNSTVDFSIGGQATTSAKFAVLNVNSGTPVASLSAGTNGGSYLTAAGNLATTAMQSLTIGGTTTGNVILNSGNGRIAILNSFRFTGVTYAFTSDSTSPDIQVVPYGSGSFNVGGKIYLDIDSGKDNANLYKSAANTVKSDGNFIAAGTLTAALSSSTTGNVVCFNTSTHELLQGAGSCSASSQRFKQNIVDMAPSDNLSEIMQLNPVSFQYKPEFSGDQSTHVGFIAEQVLQVDPRLVAFESDGVTPHTVYYENLTAILAGAVKQQQIEIASNSAAISSLTNSNTWKGDAGNFAVTNTTPNADPFFADYQVSDGSSVVDKVGAFAHIIAAKVTGGIFEGKAANLDNIKSISGNIQDLTSNTATVSGTLFANKIVASQVQIANTNIDLSDLNNQIQNDSNKISIIQNLLDDLHIQNIASASGGLTALDNLMVSGSTSLSEAAITDNLIIGNNLKVDDSSINTTGSDLAIQPLAQGGVKFLGGKIRFDIDGKVHIEQDTEFAKNVSVGGVLSAKDIAATGSATFNKINLEGSAGTATLISGSSEITIENSAVTANSLIYITPIGTSNNQVLYLKSKLAGSSFTVGVDLPAAADIRFNWIIVN